MTVTHSHATERKDARPLPGHRVRLGADRPLRLGCGAELHDFAATLTPLVIGLGLNLVIEVYSIRVIHTLLVPVAEVVIIVRHLITPV